MTFTSNELSLQTQVIKRSQNEPVLCEKIKFHSAGKNNPMYGKIRITNGFENKIILPNDTIPDGWTRGMAKRGKK